MVKKKSVISKIPRKDWQWNKIHYRYDGVHTYEGCLLWYTESYPAYAGGGAYSQSFADYIRNGSSMSDVPDEIIEEINQMLEPFIDEIMEREKNKKKHEDE